MRKLHFIRKAHQQAVSAHKSSDSRLEVAIIRIRRTHVKPKSVISVMMITSCIFEQISFRFEGAMGFHCNGKAERQMKKRKYVCAE